MGIEAAAASWVVPAIGTGLGLIQGQKESKRAKKEAGYQREQMAAESSKVAKAQSKLDAELKKSRERAAIGLARSNRSRSNKGLFGDIKSDTAMSQTPLSATLGG